MVYLSKSKYCGLWQCPKIAWLTKYKPEERTIDNSVQARMDTGNDIGEVIIEHYCKKFDTSKKDLQKAWENGWKAEDPEAFNEKDFDKKKCNIDECAQVFQKAAIMHAFLNNF